MKRDAENEYIQSLIAEGEHVHQDFKFAISDARKIARSLSAFANTEGGRLLVGVKDNGKIAGARYEEEAYMIDAAATMYCRPCVEVEYRQHRVGSKNVLEVCIAESFQKPVCVLDEKGRAWAYIRIDDENILASPVHMEVWRHEGCDERVMMPYTEVERNLLKLLGEQECLSLGQCVKRSGMSRRDCIRLLADFVRFELVEILFVEHAFYFKLKESE